MNETGIPIGEFFACCAMRFAPHRDGAAGGGEKTVGSNPSLGWAIGDENRVNMGEWSVPRGPGVLPIAGIMFLIPPALSRATSLAYTAPIWDFWPKELDHV